MFLRIEHLPLKQFVGTSMRMSLSSNKTAELWRSFMPRRNEINTIDSSKLYSLQVFDHLVDITTPTLDNEFTKWALLEVSDLTSIPSGMEAFTLTDGLYAVFNHTGPSTAFMKTFQYIYQTWLPTSGFEIDHRPQFEILGPKYKREHPDSEEEIWMPIKAMQLAGN